MVKKSGVFTLGERGNTVTLSRDKTEEEICVKTKFKKWCWTYNNFSKEDIEDVKKWCGINCKKWVFGEEIGEEGTPHLQGYFVMEKGIRITGFKKILVLCKFHFEVVKGTEEENIDYCTKDGKFHKSKNIFVKEKLKIIHKLKRWQKDLENLLLNDFSDRSIYWIYDKTGCIGKSAFIKYMVVEHNSLLCGGGKKSDVINIIFNNRNYMESSEKKMIVFDIPRCNKGAISYAAIEEIKNGIIINTKFETGTFLCNSPSICIFSNDPPDITKFSLDKWELYEVIDDKLEKINVYEVVGENGLFEFENPDNDFI